MKENKFFYILNRREFGNAPLALIISSMFGLGFVKFFGHAINTVLFVSAAWAFNFFLGFYGLLALNIIIAVIGIVVSNRVILGLKVHDPSYIIIDESVGILTALTTSIMLVFSFFFNASYTQYALIDVIDITFYSMLFFALFDLAKPLFIKKIDISMKNGYGVVLDDVLAGAFAGIATFFLFYFKYLILRLF
jgi:phosphatidylglycerophosphatase A